MSLTYASLLDFCRESVPEVAEAELEPCVSADENPWKDTRMVTATVLPIAHPAGEKYEAFAVYIRPIDEYGISLPGARVCFRFQGDAITGAETIMDFVNGNHPDLYNPEAFTIFIMGENGFVQDEQHGLTKSQLLKPIQILKDNPGVNAIFFTLRGVQYSIRWRS